MKEENVEVHHRSMSTKQRYEYIKNMSTHTCEYLEQEKFRVSKEELDVFFQLLQQELKFKFRFKF